MKDDRSGNSQDAGGATLEALERLLAPLVRLALRVGLKYQDLDALLRRVLVREATAALNANGKNGANASQVSVMTGLHRKQLGGTDTPDLATKTDSRAAAARRSLASLVLTRWVMELDRHPERVSLPLSAPDAATLSFAGLTAGVVTDVHYRAVLDELVRLGLVQEVDGMAELLTDRFVPRHPEADRIAVPFDNARALLDTIVTNVTDTGTPMLEHAIWGAGISRADCDRLDALARATWTRTRDEFFREISDTPEAPAGQPRYRLRVGMYVNAEPMEDNGAKE
jgi:hypothetical protein